MKPVLVLLSFLAFIAMAACNKPSAQQVPPTSFVVPHEGQPAEPEDLAARLDAAHKIKQAQPHDEALSKLAVDAAASENVSLVRQAIDRIIAIEIHDETTAAAAIVLAKRGQTKAATELTYAIKATEIRDKALSAIVKGQ